MKDKQSLLRELEEKFQEIRKDLNLKSTFEDLDSAFFIKDAILYADFVSENFSRQICSRIMDTYIGWTNYLHNLVIPNPGNILQLTESQFFNEEDKQEILNLMTKINALISKNLLNGLTKNKFEEAKFVDASFNFWQKEFRPAMITTIERITVGWKEKSENQFPE